ncbi:RlpA-like double-psi beta-barrel domain-containing protein [Deinococcus radiomollis]|uniref:septal ring lytic transglycosylase RlpA family protein n=1 Tax=Deinococcus radiomollis TaxID=468916 RepID=UPI0038926FBE
MRAWRQAGLLVTLAFSAAVLSGRAGADRVYRVQPGDSLYSLAKKTSTTVAKLQRMNSLNSARLRAGQAIKLPGGAAPVVRNAPAQTDSAVASQMPVPTVYQRGMAVYYGGRRDERTVLTAAHLSLPFGTWVEVTHTRTGKSVLVLINDRGPFGRSERIIDLSSAAARTLGIMGEGVAPVTLRIARIP